VRSIISTPPPVPFLDLTAQYLGIREEVDLEIAAVLRDSTFIGGERVTRFEGAFASYLDAGYCIGVANGTDAIEIALESLDPPQGGEVIVPANSFIASSEAVSRSGLRVVFADVDDTTYVLDPTDVESRITNRTVGILAVHLYGHPAPMPKLTEIAGRHGIWVLEDAAQAHGAETHGKRVGTLGIASTFSFYPGKNLGAYGDAGAITTNDPLLARSMRMLANHGRISKYEHEFEGRNSRLDALQAAVLEVKLRHLESWTNKRRKLAKRYSEGLTGVGDLIMPSERADSRHVYHLYVVRTSRRDKLLAALASANIAAGIHYPVALPRLRAYATHPQHLEAFKADMLSAQVLSLPMGDGLTNDHVDRVIEVIRAFFN
jgi:dTDP-4-amino-4,6-dideoxygalactose transaminase